MCESMCQCVICEMELAEKRGFLRLDELEPDALTREQLKALDLFDEFVKSGLGS